MTTIEERLKEIKEERQMLLTQLRHVQKALAELATEHQNLLMSSRED